MVKAMGATNVQVDIDVHDNQTGKNFHYENPQGQLFQTYVKAEVLPCQ